MAEAVSGILPLEDKATAMRIPQLVGEALGSAVGAGRFYADSEGFRLASPLSGPLRAKAAMTNTGSLAGMRALHIQHVFAAIGALSPAAFRVAAHGAVDADPV